MFDYSNGTDRKQIWLNELKLPVDLRQALTGFHALTGNDYVSSFFRKGKSTCWDIMKDDNVIVEALTQLGQSWDLSEDIEKVLEKFVCKLYGSRRNSINKVRFQLFQRKQKKGVIIHLSLLPPSKSALHLHFERANYVARIWKLAGTAMVSPPSPTGCGWDVDGDVEWIEDMFPDHKQPCSLGWKWIAKVTTTVKVKIATQTTNITERRKVTEKRTMMEIMTTTMT